MDDLLLSEYLVKKARLSKYLEEKNLDGVFLTRRSNYSWVTCGARNKIADCADNGSASLLFYKDKLCLFTTNIEMQRMIDEEMILSSRPGIKYSDIFINEINKFKEHGLENEWVNHHQGGPIGYEGRYFLAEQQSNGVIEENHAIAWNPSMRGFKSEDTFIVGKEKNLIITEDENWPKIEIKTKYGKISRPDILIK